jgi:hypothetical protein
MFPFLIFFIYSCQKNLHKALLLYDFIYGKVKYCKIYIIYGGELQPKRFPKSHHKDLFQIREDKFIVLNVEDGYEHLTSKTLALFRTFLRIHPTTIGMFKCDDDILPNFAFLNKTIQIILEKKYQNREIPYMGKSVKLKKKITVNEKTTNDTQDQSMKTFFLLPNCFYATGPIYYISKKSVETILQHYIHWFFPEDVTVGYNLNLRKIVPLDVPLYTNEFCEHGKYNFQNIDGGTKFLFVPLHGELGNQLFQIAAGYFWARRHARILVLFYSPAELKETESYANTLLKRFHVVFTDNVFAYFTCEKNKKKDKDKDNEKDKDKEKEQNYIVWKELYFEEDIPPQKHIVLEGTFVYKPYFPEWWTQIKEPQIREREKDRFLSFFENPLLYQRIYSVFSKSVCDQSYFIHVCLNHEKKKEKEKEKENDPFLPWEEYYTKSTQYVLSRDQNAHFFIFSDDLASCKSLAAINALPSKTFVKHMDKMHSFYFMSMCAKGGICSNNPLSGWATLLKNKNENENSRFPKHTKEKIVVFPKTGLYWTDLSNLSDLFFPCTITF